MKAGRTRQWFERFQWPLGMGIVLLILEVLMPEHRRAAVVGMGTTGLNVAEPVRD